MFDFYFLPLPLYVAEAIASGIYNQEILNSRYSKRMTVVLWTIIYLGVDIVINEWLKIDNDIISVVVNLALLLALQSVFFIWDCKKQIFVALSFSAGRKLTRYIISVLYILISSLSGGFVESMIASAKEMTLERAKLITNMYQGLLCFICVAAYVVIISIYLRILAQKYKYRGYEPSIAESCFLLFPCVTAICVSITLRILVVKAAEGMPALVYEQAPEAMFWIIVICVLLLGSIIATMILFQYLIERNEENRRQIILEKQVEQLHREISEIEEIYTDLRGMKHDMRNHLNNIVQYVNSCGNADIKEIDGYIGQIEDAVDRLDFSSKSGNPITDIIIYQRQQEAGKYGISFVADFVAPTAEQIDIYDIAVILNNALDNAFEACRCLDGSREVILRSYMKGTLFFIEVENDFDGGMTLDKDTGLPVTNKKDKRLHGIGISNIQKCARKYMGDVDIEMRSDGGRKKFLLTVMLSGKISLQK